MAIQYYMRAFNTSLSQYVDWIVNDTPDNVGTYSGYSPGNLTNITVNKTVQSKIANFLKPNEGLGGTDGYFFHLNSYDWLHATPPGPPIGVPTNLVGMAVVRGSVDGYVARDYSCLMWDETNQRWHLAFNTAGNGTTIGSYIPISMGAITIDGYIAVGTNPALTGIIRVPNNQFMVSRNAANSGDGYVVGLDNLNRVRLGSLASDPVYVPGNLRIDGYLRDGGANPSLTGFIRNSNATSIITFRNAANGADLTALSTNASNNIIIGDSANAGLQFNTVVGGLHQFQVNAAPIFEIGTNFVRFPAAVSTPSILQVTPGAGSSGQTLTIQAQNGGTGATTGGIISLTSGTGGSFSGTVDLNTGGVLKMRVFPTTAPAAGDNNSILFFENLFRVDTAQTNPTIRQDLVATGSATGQTLTLQAQNATGATSNGGALNLTSGTGTTIAGPVDIQTGGASKLNITPTITTHRNNIEQFDLNRSNPVFRQETITTPSTNGQTLTVQAQNATGVTSIGGDLSLTSGTGTTRDGYVLIKTGGNTQITVTPTTTFITGNLTVSGTTTTINSTVVDIADRIIHVNNTTGTVGVPTLITGYAVHRGNTGSADRDHAGLYWNEPDGYWKLAFNTAGDDTNLNVTLPIIASTFLAQATAATSPTTIPTVGGFRTLNNTTAVSSRNAASSLDLLLLGTDNTDHITHGSSANNNGHIFNTAAAKVYDFQVNSASQVQISLSNITFTNTVSAPIISQGDVTGVGSTGANLTVHAQNATGATSIGGDLVLAGGTGTTRDGYVRLRTGLVDKLVVDGLIATWSLPTVAFDGYQINPSLIQNVQPTNGVDGYNFLIKAQSSTVSPAHGGNLLLQGGDGYSSDGYIRDGYVILAAGSTEQARVVPNKFNMSSGQRIKLTDYSPTPGDGYTYNVLANDFVIMVNTTTFASFINLPLNPIRGDLYQIKDSTGSAATHNISISGNGHNIDGSTPYLLNTGGSPSVLLTYNGTQWSVL